MRAFVLGCWVASVLLLGCRDRPVGAPASGAAAAAPADPSLPPLAPGALRVYVDGKAVLTIAPTAVPGWPRLDRVLGDRGVVADWQRLRVFGNGTPLDIEAPSRSHTGLVPAVFPGAAGPSFGLFTEEAHKARGTPQIVLAQAREIRIERTAAAIAAAADDDDHGGGRGGGGGEGAGEGGGQGGGQGRRRAMALSVEIVAGAKTHRLDVAQLAAVPMSEPPSGEADRGWSLSAILASVGVTAPTKVTLTDETGASLPVTATDLTPERGMAFLKLNKQGQLRFKLYVRDTATAPWQPRGDLRGVTRIVAE